MTQKTYTAYNGDAGLTKEQAEAKEGVIEDIAKMTGKSPTEVRAFIEAGNADQDTQLERAEEMEMDAVLSGAK